MWLKQLKLKNFQKHTDLVLDFTPGVNIIYGHSDAGKSCIRRAIGFVFFGDPRTDDVIRKEGTKQTSVCAVLDNGTEVERVKSASINRYVIRVPGNKEVTFDSIGADIPEEVQQVLQTRLVEIDKNSLNLNIAEQVCLPFLSGADFPASARLKLFNKLTGNDLLDVLVQNINKEIVNIRRNLTVQENVVKTNEPEIEKLGLQITLKKKTLDAVKARKEAIEKKYEILSKLSNIAGLISSNRVALQNTLRDLGRVETVDDSHIVSLKGQSELLVRLMTLKTGITTTKTALDTAKAGIAQIKAPELNGDAFRAKIARLEKVVGLQAQMAVIQTRIDGVKKDYKPFLDGLLPAQEEEYKAILKEAGVCPTCKQACENLEHIKI